MSLLTNNYFHFGRSVNGLQDSNLVDITCNINQVIYYGLFNILFIINFTILVIIMVLTISNKWILLIDSDFISLLPACSIITLLAILIAPCKRSNNKEVQKSFILIILGCIFLESLSSWYSISLLYEMKNSNTIINNSTIRFRNKIKNIYYHSNCSLVEDVLICDRTRWFSNYINNNCPILNISNLGVDTIKCINEIPESNNSINMVFCNCVSNLTTILVNIVLPLIVMNLISIFISICLAIIAVHVYRKLANNPRINTDSLLP